MIRERFSQHHLNIIKFDRVLFRGVAKSQSTGRQSSFNHQNYTDIGFKKIKAPEQVFKLIKEFWDANKDKEKTETWGVANTYT